LYSKGLLRLVLDQLLLSLLRAGGLRLEELKLSRGWKKRERKNGIEG